MVDFWDCKECGEGIICPYCKHEQDFEILYSYVTYWGDDGNHKECSCESCGKEFMVIERVTREFGTYKIGEQQNGKEM